MIHLTRLNGAGYVLNADLIQTLESTPDTTITLVGGQKMNVLEAVDEVIRRVVAFRRTIVAGPGSAGPGGENVAEGEER